LIDTVPPLIGSFTTDMAKFTGNIWTGAINFENDNGVFITVNGETEKIGNSSTDRIYKGAVFSTDVNGNTKEIIKNVNVQKYLYDHGNHRYFYPEVGPLSEGLFYFSDKNIDGEVQGFFDINGTKAIDLSEYNLSVSNSNAMFSGGYCLLYLQNDQGSSYYTVIDKSGQMMFEPRKRENNEKLILRCGMVVMEKAVMDAYGEIIAEFDKLETVSDYFDDIALVEVNDYNSPEIYYIDKSGNRIF
jgi:hypothetical protein